MLRFTNFSSICILRLLYDIFLLFRLKILSIHFPPSIKMLYFVCSSLRLRLTQSQFHVSFGMEVAVLRMVRKMGTILLGWIQFETPSLNHS